MSAEDRFPTGWDDARVQRLLDHYEQQTDAEALAEDEAVFESPTETVMGIPNELVARVRELLARHRSGRRGESGSGTG